MTRAAKRTSSPSTGLFPSDDEPVVTEPVEVDGKIIGHRLVKPLPPPAPVLTFDEARSAYPEIGVAIYAIEPGGPVTVEVYSSGQVYSFIAPTADEAMGLAFPPDVPDDVFG